MGSGSTKGAAQGQNLNLWIQQKDIRIDIALEAIRHGSDGVSRSMKFHEMYDYNHDWTTVVLWREREKGQD
jgi:hypothetical protein